MNIKRGLKRISVVVSVIWVISISIIILLDGEIEGMDGMVIFLGVFGLIGVMVISGV